METDNGDPEVMSESAERDGFFPAVCVRNAWKAFGGTNVLTGLDMTVKRGHIYALLGASGCGKTTVLSAIVARNKLDGGYISVYGHEPGTPESGMPGWRLGYMPQDVALYNECTIHEVCFFFGRIYGMNGKLIKERMEFYRDLLQMPESTRFIGSLSGGQQRRVSFAVALLNKPQLLILDEPTVGVDSLLRQKIWDHLQSLATSSKHTILITTHYIEEARHANMVGMMYGGKVLVEGEPEHLMQKHNCARMEDVFYNYCTKHNTELKESDPLHCLKSHVGAVRYPTQLQKIEDMDSHSISLGKEIRNSMKRLKAIYLRTFSRLFHTPIMLLFVMSVPPSVTISYCIALGEQFKYLPLGVYNGEYPSEPVCTAVPGECFFGNLSCLYLDKVDTDMFTLVPYSSAEEAYNATASRKVWASIIFPSNFSDSVQVRYASGASITDLGIVKSSHISLVIDKSDIFLGTFIQMSVIDRYITLIKNVFDSCEIDSTIADRPVDVSDPFPENKDASVRTNFVGPMMLIIIFMNTGFVGIVLLSKDTRDGVLDRIAVSGVRPLELIAALELNAITMMVFQLIITFLIAFPLFGLPFYGGIVYIFTIAVLQGICGCIYGFLTTILVPDLKGGLVFALGVFFVFLTFGGIMWPMEALPDFIYYPVNMLPLTIPISTIRLLMVRSWSITSALIWRGFAVSIAWIIVFLILTVVTIRKFRKF